MVPKIFRKNKKINFLYFQKNHYMFILITIWAEEGVLGQVPVGPVVIDTNMEHLGSSIYYVITLIIILDIFGQFGHFGRFWTIWTFLDNFCHFYCFWHFIGHFQNTFGAFSECFWTFENFRPSSALESDYVICGWYLGSPWRGQRNNPPGLARCRKMRLGALVQRLDSHRRVFLVYSWPKPPKDQLLPEKILPWEWL